MTALVTLGAVFGLAGLVGLALGVPFAGLAVVGLLAPLGDAAGVHAASVRIGRGLGRRSRLLLPLVVMTMHLSWGANFLQSVPRSDRR